MELLKADVGAEKRKTEIVFRGDIFAFCRIAGIVFAWFAGLTLRNYFQNRIAIIAIFPGIANVSCTESGDPDLGIRQKQILDQQNFYIE